MLDKANDEHAESGPWVQVSRLGNPLFNEVVVPMGKKDKWNATHPAGDKAFAKYVEHPELAKLLPVLYPGVFPQPRRLKAKRADLVAILLTGIPTGIIPGFQNYTGTTLGGHAAAERRDPARRSPSRARSGCSAATWPGSRTAAACSTTS